MKDGESAKDYVDRYMEDYYRAAEEAERTGLTLIYGIEARFTENSNDYLVYGVDGQETRNLFPNLATGLSDFRKKYHNDNMIFIQAHPCRHGCLRMEPSLLDGVEVINLHPHHNSMLGFAANMQKKSAGSLFQEVIFIIRGLPASAEFILKRFPETHLSLQIYFVPEIIC